MARYSSSRSNRALKVGALIITLVGAIGFTNVAHTFDRSRHAMANDPAASVLLIVGILLVLFAFRDTLLSPFGWVSPARAERLIKGYLETQHYKVTRETPSPDFVLTAEDDSTRKFSIMWLKEPYIHVLISSQWGIGDVLAPVWATATPADLRALNTRLMEVGTRLEGGGAVVKDLADADKANIFYATRIPR